MQSLVWFQISTIKPGEYVYLVFTGSLVKSLVCKTDFILVATTTLAAQTTSKEHTTTKFSYILAAKYSGNILGFILQGLFLKTANFAGCFLISVGTYLIISVLMVILMPDNRNRNADTSSIFSLYWDTITLMTRKPKGGTLLALWAVMIIILLHKSVRDSEYALTVLYVNTNIKSFTSSDFAWYWIVKQLGNIIAVTLGMHLLKKWEVRDIHVAIFAAFTNIIKFSMLSVTHTTFMLYISTLIGSFSAIFITTSKSFISIIVSEEQHGKAYSLLFSFEVLSDLLGPIFYLNIYKFSIHFFSGLLYLVIAFVYLCILVASIYLMFSFHSTHTDKDRKNETQELLKSSTETPDNQTVNKP